MVVYVKGGVEDLPVFESPGSDNPMYQKVM